MARITTEDCSKVIPDRFKLVVYATKLAKLLNYKIDSSPHKKKKYDKPSVEALRRIALGNPALLAQLEQDFLNGLRKNRVEPIVEQEESEDSEEKFEYLPEVYIGEDYSDLDDQDFVDDNFEEYEDK